MKQGIAIREMNNELVSCMIDGYRGMELTTQHKVDGDIELII